MLSIWLPERTTSAENGNLKPNMKLKLRPVRSKDVREMWKMRFKLNRLTLHLPSASGNRYLTADLVYSLLNNEGLENISANTSF